MDRNEWPSYDETFFKIVGCRFNISKPVPFPIDSPAVIMGDQDVKRLAGHEKNSKHRKGEELILKGHPIRIIRETVLKS
ncbi:MAG: hypothetical protein O3A78_09825 [Nitrospinae bacterium]|nr:hypothetical protein [Nitrospinota bacterium]MDA1110090.1 hypothetical protein [Nitrospinota bacterium]